ncbi:MAG: peptidase M24, Xaa-Pro aminopeptidase [Candidatus Peregrinibacteria bacterium GW2011_GWF2_33_10]|nr:MAG: peptidase M24, Xaa-Pro aminopeptidase [Candidatus Peregrinibacteria bacterium GW2011_GWF2_33_10]OGJ45325.1 MAG: hypothetical protein A2272_06240 [Candidatus Peregrinibacteria bacterium RIFOXYA12_FULL_33_12]OGJ45383.1 MAG: hypothetical protein A2263_03900 [Candidatus Peregrinibacteria bacterium RIFOXYA2_FULL_33_21]OGJ50986.1 MAG: hypothetical protein A2307_05495 [Candidatus Peregrinibacteria bacterium RIFOXYB2_FULL_33_20]
MTKNILITNPINVRYLTSFCGSFGQILITKKKIYLLTDPRYFDYAKTLLKNKNKSENSDQSKITIICAKKSTYPKTLQHLLKKHQIQKLYFEPNHLTVAELTKLKKNLSLPTTHLSLLPLPSQNSIENLRCQKTKEEISLLQKSQQINENILQIIVKNLKNGLTEKAIAWQIKELAFQNKCEDLAFEPIVAFGKNSAIPHHHNTDKKFSKGDIILIDMGVKYQGYCSDMTRTFFTKKPSQIEQNIYSIVLEAQEKTINEAKVGFNCTKLDAIARNSIKKHGYKKYFTHGSGHGIGLNIHEYPSLSEKSLDIAPINAVITIEPGIYLSNQFGIRIEDMILLTENGVTSLTKFPKKIKEICIF